MRNGRSFLLAFAVAQTLLWSGDSGAARASERLNNLTASADAAPVPLRPAGRVGCWPEDDHRDVLALLKAERGQTRTSARSAPGLLRVPLVIRVMDAQGDQRAREYWRPDMLLRYFGTGDFSVNRVWRQAGIQFDVQAITSCAYDAPPPAIVEPNVVVVPDPVEIRHELLERQRDIVDGYLRVNELYGTQRALNAYLWWGISGAANAYGESPRRNRVEVVEQGRHALPTLWIESGLRSCASDCDDERQSCQLLIAHEIGHALGLRHACLDCDRKACRESCREHDGYLQCQPRREEQRSGTAPEPCPWGRTPDQILSDGLTAAGEPMECCRAKKGRLMHPRRSDTGMELRSGEVHSARAAVREFFGGGTWRAPWR